MRYRHCQICHCPVFYPIWSDWSWFVWNQALFFILFRISFSFLISQTFLFDFSPFCDSLLFDLLTWSAIWEIILIRTIVLDSFDCNPFLLSLIIYGPIWAHGFICFICSTYIHYTYYPCFLYSICSIYFICFLSLIYYLGVFHLVFWMVWLIYLLMIF